jgi:PIN domain nuclease of toxin-antitoxin system
MKILIDTQCWLWLNAEPERFSSMTLEQLKQPAAMRLLSAASVWELAIKVSTGRLVLPDPLVTYVPSRLAETRTEVLPITGDHALRVAALPWHHRDPFDRLIIAQGQIEGVQILTADDTFREYDVGLMAP